MVGRNLKIVENNKKHFTKEEKESRVNVEELASKDLTPLQKTPPKHFNTVAKAEYKRLINDLQKLPLRNLDRGVLESYCTWYAIYKDIDKRLNEMGYVILIDTDYGEQYVENPLIKTLERATKNIKGCASSLGLTVDSRMRIYMPPKEEKGKSIFDKFS